jgi:DNA repair protein RecO (recombination protein O)
MITKTRGIVLRIEPFSKTSHVVTWLTPDLGRVLILVKGAQRRKSAFLGQYDFFYSCEILYYTREGTTLQILKECWPEKTRERLRSNWRATVCASYFCDLVARLCPTGEGHAGVYALMDLALDCLHSQGTAESVAFWFELRILGLLGFAPQLTTCCSCGAGLGVEDADQAIFSVSRGGLRCNRCSADATEITIPITSDVLAILRRWQASDNPQLARNTVFTRRQYDSAEEILGVFLRYHLDPPLGSRDIAHSLIHGTVASHRSVRDRALRR